MTKRNYLKTNHEEADTITTSQAIYGVELGQRVFIESGDTDFYVLILYHNFSGGLNLPMFLPSFKKGRAAIDINLTGTIEA